MNTPIYTVFDIETTGLSAACMSEIIEFAGFHLDSEFNIIDKMHLYVKPYRPIPKKISDLTGITNEKVSRCPGRYDALPKIRSFIGDTICVAHNAEFDFNFISMMCIQQNLPILRQYICTMKSYKKIEGEKKGKLADACEKYGISLEHAHTAEDDALATVHLFQKLNEKCSFDVYHNKWHTKNYNGKDLFIKLMTSIADKNPNKYVNNALSYQQNIGFRKLMESDIANIYDLFEQKMDPVQVHKFLSLSGDDVDFYSISCLFAIWLNEKRLPKFIYLEDPSITRQVKQMISYVDSFADLLQMHRDIYASEDINYAIYVYYYIKYRKSLSEDDLISIFNDFLKQKITVMTLFSGFNCDKISHSNPVKNAAIKSFIEYAKTNKHIVGNREFIKMHLCSKKELQDAILSKQIGYENGVLKHLRTEISVNLYNEDFFQVKVA